MVTNKQLLWYSVFSMVFWLLLAMTGETFPKNLGGWLFVTGTVALVLFLFNKLVERDGI